jgi:predicted ATPase
MRLKQVQIENFKCFKKTQEIEFNRLTILTGANSSGKSSIIYSILGLIQSQEFPFQFSTNGKYVNMGDFKEISYNHESANKIKIRFKLIRNSTTIGVDSIWVEDKTTNLPKLSSFNVMSESYKLSVRKIGKKLSLNFTYDPTSDRSTDSYRSESFQNFFTTLSAFMNDEKPAKSGDEKKATTPTLAELYKSINQPQDIKGHQFDNFDELYSFAAKTNMRLFTTLFEFQKLFKEFDEKINFISSFRLHPERTYLEKSKVEFKVEKFGEGYLDQIISWEGKKSKKFKDLLKIMKNLSLLHEIKTNRLEGGRYEMLVRTKYKGALTSLSDVGFGISQFLPIIVADLQLSEDSTLFIAQPEIHLHPNVQSLFGDYITSKISSTQKNYVIETHSEYFLNKIRLLIVKGNIPENEVATYFIDSNTQIHKINFTKSGQIIGAPDDFFKTYMMDVMEIALNAE